MSMTVFAHGVHLIIKLRKDMKNNLLSLLDKLLLRKRALIETVNDQLKNILQIEHSRHRSVSNFLVNLVEGLISQTRIIPRSPRCISACLQLPLGPSSPVAPSISGHLKTPSGFRFAATAPDKFDGPFTQIWTTSHALRITDRLLNVHMSSGLAMTLWPT